MKHWCVSTNHLAADFDTLTEYRALAVTIHEYMWSLYAYTSVCVCAASKMFDIFTDEYKPHRRTSLIHPTMGPTANTRTTWLRAIGFFRAIDQNRDLTESTHLNTDQLTQEGGHRSRFYQSERINMHVCTSPRIKGTDCNMSYIHITRMYID